MVRSIREEWTEETGEDPGRVGAEVILDRMCEAFLHYWEGAGPCMAVATHPDTARYLSTRWAGEDGRRLRAALAERDQGVRTWAESLRLAHQTLSGVH